MNVFTNGLQGVGLLIAMMSQTTLNMTINQGTTYGDTHQLHSCKYESSYCYRLQNRIIAFMLKHKGRRLEDDDYSGYQRVKSHENGVFLYKSRHAYFLKKVRTRDYFVLFWFAGFATGYKPIYFLPFIVSMMSMPRKAAQVRFFTYHAELLPHTEQVIFHKITMFGF